MGVSSIRARNHAIGPTSDQDGRSNHAGTTRRPGVELASAVAVAPAPAPAATGPPPPPTGERTARHRGHAGLPRPRRRGSRPCSSSASSDRRAAGRSWAKAHTNTAVLTSAISVTPSWDRIASPIPSQSRMLGLSG